MPPRAKPAQKTVAVTGGAGFLGRAVVRDLVATPGIGRVIGIDQHTADVPGVEWVKADVRNARAMRDAVDGADVVLHLAFVVIGDLTEADDINLRGSDTVFRATAEAGVKRLVHMSSCAAYGYGTRTGLLTEDAPLRPVTQFTYSRTKAGAEAMLDAVEKDNPTLDVVRLRPVVILGPGAHGPLRQWAKSRVTPLVGGDPPVQFVALDDVVSACRLAVLGTATGAFNIAGDGTTTLRALARATGKRPVRVSSKAVRGGMRVVGKLRPHAGIDLGWLDISTQPPNVDTTRAKTVLGWTPTATSHQAALTYLETTK